MNMLRELRQNYASFIADAESSIALAEPPAEAAKPAVYHVYPVSPPTVMRLGFEDWLPPAYRGLEVYFPAEDWRIPAEPLAATSSAGDGKTRRSMICRFGLENTLAICSTPSMIRIS